MFANLMSELHVSVYSFPIGKICSILFCCLSASLLHFSAATIRRLIKQGKKDAETALTQQKKEIRKLRLI
jgi:hypothetical protein